jgi:hypothetical protein
MNTANDQLVGVRGERILVLNPKQDMSKEEAVRHAAWILVLAGMDLSYVAQQMLAIEET